MADTALQKNALVFLTGDLKCILNEFLVCNKEQGAEVLKTGVLKNLGMASVLAASSVHHVTLHMQLPVFLLETITK